MHGTSSRVGWRRGECGAEGKQATLYTVSVWKNFLGGREILNGYQGLWLQRPYIW